MNVLLIRRRANDVESSNVVAARMLFVVKMRRHVFLLLLICVAASLFSSSNVVAAYCFFVVTRHRQTIRRHFSHINRPNLSSCSCFASRPASWITWFELILWITTGFADHMIWAWPAPGQVYHIGQILPEQWLPVKVLKIYRPERSETLWLPGSWPCL